MVATATTQGSNTETQLAAGVGTATSLALDVGAEQAVEALARKVTAVNNSLTLSNDGKSLVAGQTELKSLALALKEGQSVELSPSVLTRGLSDQNDPNLQAAARKTLEAELSKEQYGGKINLPKEAEGAGAPKPAEKKDEKPKLEHTLKLNDNGKGGASTLKVMNPTGEGTQNYDVFYEAEQKENAPAVSIFKNTKEPGIAYVVVSRRSADGKIESTEVAAVSSADALGTEGNRPSNLGARIFTKDGKEQIGTMNLSGLDLAAMQAQLKEKLKQPEAPKTPEKPADGEGKAQEGKTSDGGAKAAEGASAGGGNPQPPSKDKGKPPPPNRAGISAGIKCDGKLSPEESTAFLAMLKEPDAKSRLQQEYGLNAVNTVGRNLEIEVGPDRKIRINWNTGAASVGGRQAPSSEEITNFEKLARSIITGSHLPAAGMARSLPRQNDFTVNNHFSEAERKALKRALENETFVKDLANRLGYSIPANDTYPRIQMSGPSSKRELTGVDILTFNRETGAVDFTLGNKKPGPLSFLDGLILSDRYALKPSTREEIIQANTVALKRVIISMLKK